MFAHLDDAPFEPAQDFREQTMARARRLGRTRRWRQAGALASLVIVAGVLTVGAIRQSKGPTINRVDIGPTTSRAVADTEAAPDRPTIAGQQIPLTPDSALGTVVAASMQPATFLLVGSDARDSSEQSTLGMGARTDTIMLVRIDQQTGTVRLLSIPRDLWVSDPASGQSTRINGTWSTGGPRNLIAAIKQTFDIDVDHYIGVDFSGFIRAVDQLGGVDVTFPAPARDTYTGLSVAQGCVHLTGSETLELARSRHYQALSDNTWTDDPTSDLGRIQRQQALLSIVLGQLSSGTPGRTDNVGLAEAIAGDLTLDVGLTVDSLARYARASVALQRQGGISGTRPAVHGMVIGTANVLGLDPGAAVAAKAFLLGQTQTTPSVTGAADKAGTPATIVVGDPVQSSQDVPAAGSSPSIFDIQPCEPARTG